MKVLEKPVDQLVKIVSDTKLPFAIVGSSEQAAELNKERAEGKELSIYPYLLKPLPILAPRSPLLQQLLRPKQLHPQRMREKRKLTRGKKKKGEG